MLLVIKGDKKIKTEFYTTPYNINLCLFYEIFVTYAVNDIIWSLS